MVAIVIYLSVVKKLLDLKTKTSASIKHSLCLGNLSFDYYTKNQTKYTGLYGNVYDFSNDYSAITNDKILHIHKYLMEKKNIK